MCAVARLESAPLGIKVAPRDDEEAASGGGPPALAAARAKAAAASSSSNSKPSSPAPSATVTTVTPTSIPEGAAPSEPSRLRYSYYVAGSGGAGPAVLAATLLLAGRDAAAWKDGSKLTRPAFSEPLPADFGRFIGRKTVYLIDLPEVEAAAVDLRVPSVSARFATAPGIFNLGTVLLARLLPKSVLGDRGFASSAAGVLGPLVAAADAAMKALPVAIRVDLELKKKTERDDGRDGDGGGATSTSMATTTGTKSGSELRAPRRERRRDDPFLRGDDEQASSSAFVHRDMATAVGACTAAFARELLFGGGARADKNEKLSVPVGVCRPEALPAESRERILRDVAENSGAARFEVGAPPWALDSEPTRLGEFDFFFCFFFGFFFFFSLSRSRGTAKKKNSLSSSFLLLTNLLNEKQGLACTGEGRCGGSKEGKEGKAGRRTEAFSCCLAGGGARKREREREEKKTIITFPSSSFHDADFFFL